MGQKSVDIEKIAKMLTDSSDREETSLQKIAELESEIASLKAELSTSQVTFQEVNRDTDIKKEASLNEFLQDEMGSVAIELDPEQALSGSSKLLNWMDTL